MLSTQRALVSISMVKNIIFCFCIVYIKKPPDLFAAPCIFENLVKTDGLTVQTLELATDIHTFLKATFFNSGYP